mmetsp:Transcript_109201/g.307950  ORF Transcript_109201/g.307950 Transcript_109201/m.307950 type:complete len:220 (-) Transcript_109201:1515-2174(-)
MRGPPMRVVHDVHAGNATEHCKNKAHLFFCPTLRKAADNDAGHIWWPIGCRRSGLLLARRRLLPARGKVGCVELRRGHGLVLGSCCGRLCEPFVQKLRQVGQERLSGFEPVVSCTHEVERPFVQIKFFKFGTPFEAIARHQKCRATQVLLQRLQVFTQGAHDIGRIGARHTLKDPFRKRPRALHISVIIVGLGECRDEPSSLLVGPESHITVARQFPRR